MTLLALIQSKSLIFAALAYAGFALTRRFQVTPALVLQPAYRCARMACR